jgi:hypothetical protein
MAKTLINHDYLPVHKDPQVDLKVVSTDSGLVFEHRGKPILRTSVNEFLSNPSKLLKEFSLRSDRKSFFRWFTFNSLWFGFPLTLYILVYALIRVVLGIVCELRTSAVIASILCFLIGIALLLPLHFARSDVSANENLHVRIDSRRWQTRVHALQIIGQRHLEIADFPSYKKMISSPYIPERYWLAKALGVSRHPDTYNALGKLLADSHPNVVCMAYEAIAKRGDRRFVEEILKQTKVSGHWYTQMYAYKALRALGWTQKKST